MRVPHSKKHAQSTRQMGRYDAFAHRPEDKDTYKFCCKSKSCDANHHLSPEIVENRRY